MVANGKDVYTFVNKGRAIGEEEIDHIVTSGGHVNHLFQITEERQFKEF